MPVQETHAVTGAYGYSGKYIAQRLLDAGHTVITLTNSPRRANPFGDRIRAIPLDFDRPDLLAKHLQGVSVLYNTYWVRFNHRLFRHADAVRNTLALFAAARQAGVRRIVHISITNPSEDSPLEYFRGKARLEKVLMDSGISYAILRPAILFGKEDILVNNIAWTLRRLPVFGVFGDGRYRLQPIHVDDLAGPGRRASGDTRKRDRQRHRARDVFLSGACGVHRRCHRPPASHSFRSALVRLCHEPSRGKAGRRCNNNPRRDQRLDGRLVVRRCSARRKDRFDAMGESQRGYTGAKVRERVGKTERPNGGLRDEFRAPSRSSCSARGYIVRFHLPSFFISQAMFRARFLTVSIPSASCCTSPLSRPKATFQ